MRNNNSANLIIKKEQKMKKSIIFLLSITLIFSILLLSVSATTYTVVSGDSLWKISKKFQVGLSEIIEANPQITNPDLIYPNQVINIPEQDASVLNYEKEVVRLVNKERSSRGLPTLTMDWQLSRVARYKSQDMHDKGYFSHTSPTYGSPFDMISAFGISYRSAGENIAKGQRTPQEVVNAWMNSSGHRANILNASFTKIGVGYVANGNYWTQMFVG